MSIENSMEYMAAGASFLRTAKKGRLRKSVFTDTMIYHVLCLSIEQYLLGIFSHHGAIPEHHTLTHMVQEASRLVDMPPFLAEQVKAMDQVLNLCDPAAPLVAVLSETQLDTMLTAGEEVAELASQYLGGPVLRAC